MNEKTTDFEIRTFRCDDLRVIRGATRLGKGPKIVGHAAVFNKLSADLGGWREQIAPGAFAEAIKNDDIRALWNHDAAIVLGRNTAGTLRLSEDKKGLAIEIDPPDTQAARDLMVSMERGDVDQMSFGFWVKPGGQSWGEDADGQAIRTLTDVGLFDVSPVTFPAYPQTDVAIRELRRYRGTGSSSNPSHDDEESPGIAIRRRALDLIEATS